MNDLPEDSISAADAIAAKATAASEPTPEAEPEPSPVASEWAVEEYKLGRYLVTRNVETPGSPLIRREVHGTSRLGSTALVFESEEAAQRCADKLNEEGEA